MEHRIDGVLQQDGIQYTKEEEKELDKTMASANPFESRTVRDRFDLAVLNKHKFESLANLDAWANKLLKIYPSYPGESNSPAMQEINAARQEFARLELEREKAAETKKKAEAKARRREEVTAVLAEWIKKETPVFLTCQSWGIAGHLAGRVQRFAGFRPDACAWLLVGCDSGDKRDLFWTFDLTATGWTLHEEGKDHRLVISTEGNGEISISDHPMTGEEFDAMFRAAVEAFSE